MEPRITEAEDIASLLKEVLESSKLSVAKTNALIARLRADNKQAKASLDFISHEFFRLTDMNANLLSTNAELHRELLRLALERHGMTEIKDHLDSLEERMVKQEKVFGPNN